MELYVDNRRVELDTAAGVAVSLGVAALTDPRKGRAGYTRTLRVPMTPTADEIFGFAGEIHSAARFNATTHTGRLEHEGAILIEGLLYLSRVRKGEYYEVHIIGAAREWVAAASSRALSATDIGYYKTLSARTIEESWTDAGIVKFLPVVRETRPADHSSGGVIPALKVLSSDDYHPFIHAASLLRVIFSQAGYALESDFLDSETFKRLYISGKYPTRDVAALKARMDFTAGRSADVSATANSQGRVYANPYVAGNTVGNLVDPPVEDGHFQMDDNRIAFIPTTPTTLGFAYRLRYTTDYRMKSRAELAGFNEVYLGEAASRRFVLANPYPDRRATFRPARSYTLAVFDHTSGRQYQLRYKAGSSNVTGATLSTAFSSVMIPSAASVSDPVLYYRASTAGSWRVYTGDWALYDGFVGETGTLDVELTLRTAPENISLGAPKFFNDIWFGGADPGMRLTLKQGTQVSPVFYAQPTEGTALTFADVCAHDVSQMTLIDAFRQMFNLRFQTDNRRRVVRMEPADGFYSSERIVDWSGRIDLGRPIEIEEIGGELSREMVWCYAGGDGAVARLNRTEGGQMGRWSASVENAAAADAVSVWENPMFTPSLGTTGAYRGAPSAILVQAGEGSGTLYGTEDLNFAPKVVRYEGVVTLPAGEAWGWPSSSGTSYPKAAFHAPESGYTLCFEDRDGCTGLHTGWERDIRLWNSSRRVTVWLDLGAVDIEALLFPGAAGPDFGCLYRLTLDGEPGLYRLEEVVDYDPRDPSTKCTFIKHIP